jgi:hypothetical protein
LLSNRFKPYLSTGQAQEPLHPDLKDRTFSLT